MNKGIIFFIISLILLVILLVRQPYRLKWVSYMFVNIIIAAALLYLLNGLEVIEGIAIPINEWTLLTIAFLGVPGLLSIIVIKKLIAP